MKSVRGVAGFAASALLLLGLGAVGAASASAIYDVSIGTANLLGTDSTLTFDFIAGGGTQSNGITISQFETDGTLISPSVSGAVPSGSVSGALPGSVALTNGSFFNEYQQGMTLGSTISFRLDATTAAPTSGSLPDTFSLFLLDPTATNSLVTSTDPTGADSLFTLQIDGSTGGLLAVYDTTPSLAVSVTPSPVPLPTGFVLLISGLLALGFLGSRERLGQRVALGAY
jgi:hypothetical protein